MVFVVLWRDTCEVVKTLVKLHFPYENVGFSGFLGLENELNTPEMAPKIEKSWRKSFRKDNIQTELKEENNGLIRKVSVFAIERYIPMHLKEILEKIPSKTKTAVCKTKSL